MSEAVLDLMELQKFQDKVEKATSFIHSMGKIFGLLILLQETVCSFKNFFELINEEIELINISNRFQKILFRSEKFWRENAHHLNDKNYELLKVYTYKYIIHFYKYN